MPCFADICTSSPLNVIKENCFFIGGVTLVNMASIPITFAGLFHKSCWTETVVWGRAQKAGWKNFPQPWNH